MKATYINHMGSDASVVNSARVSTGRHGSRTSWVSETSLNAEDIKLIKFLANHQHYTPFEHCVVTLHLKVPIFVARQIQRHRTFSYNEISRRYVDDEPEFYIPKIWRKRSESVKQGSSDEPVQPTLVRGICGQCGSKYTPTSPRHNYCSQDCQQKSWRERNPLVMKWRGWKASADRRGLEFSISEEDLDYPKYCPYLGLELAYSPNEGGILPNSASLDRIDSTKGYVKGNVQIISNRANTMKLDASEKELIEFAKNVLLRHGGIVVPEGGSVENLFDNYKILYRNLIDNGLCPEQARGFLPQALYTEFYMTGDLRNWAHFLNLRLDKHAQEEARDIARQCADIIRPLFPHSLAALLEMEL